METREDNIVRTLNPKKPIKPTYKLTPFGINLRHIRISRKELIYDMSLKLGIKPSDITRIELGECKVSRKMLKKIIKEYNLHNDEKQCIIKAYIQSIKK